MVQIMLCMLLLFLCIPSIVQSDVVCDGVDDILTSNAVVNTMMSTTTGTVFLTLKHAGSPSAGGTCGRDQLWVYSGSENVALLAHSAPGYNAKNFDGTTDCAAGAFSTDWTTLVWRHGSNTLELFVNGALATTTPSGTTSGALGSLMTLCWNGTQVDGAAPITVAQVAVYNTALSDNQIAAYGNSMVRELLPSGATALVEFNFCTPGASTDTYVWPDRSGNARHISSAQGANATGVLCAGSTGMVVMGGIQ